MVGWCFQLLPEDIRGILSTHPDRENLLEVVMDVGRRPEGRFLGSTKVAFLRDQEVTDAELIEATTSMGEFGGDNRAGIPGTLHRISCMRNRRGDIVRPCSLPRQYDTILLSKVHLIARTRARTFSYFPAFFLR